MWSSAMTVVWGLLTLPWLPVYLPPDVHVSPTVWGNNVVTTAAVAAVAVVRPGSSVTWVPASLIAPQIATGNSVGLMAAVVSAVDALREQDALMVRACVSQTVASCSAAAMVVAARVAPV